MPKISVIMPVYNGERFLNQAIESLIAQSYEDWELIVVDDGSTDRTPQLLESYTDPRIKVLRQANRGEAGARNTGLKHMSGEYLAFLDADDVYLPDALQDLSAYLDDHPALDVVFSDGLVCDQEDRHLMRLTEVRPGIFTGNILNSLVASPSVITVPVCTMTRVAIVRRHDLFFDEKDNLIGTDWDFWIRLAVHAKFGYLDKLTCRYRIHNTNITRTTKSEKRRKDGLYIRTKIMNAEWFDGLSFETRQWFFFDLLTNVLAGDITTQRQILESQPFSRIDYFKRADFWRLVAIDALSNGCSLQEVTYLLEQSLKANSNDRKTQSLLWTLKMGRLPALILVQLWRIKLAVGKKVSSLGDSRTEHLQKLMGIK
jgi:glycosyltransferase involved in cell wall biosynthesis